MTKQIILSYAKINLALEVLLRDEKSYHKLNTLICILNDYYDVLEITPSRRLEVNTSGKYAFNGENILEKVAHLFKKEFNGNVNFEVNIQKNIKIGGGLGGGSSNGATFLHFLLKQNNIFLNKKAFCEFAFKIGADVPFFYNNSPKICTNYGEVLQDVNFELPKNLFALLYIPDFEINTKQAFSLLNQDYFKADSSFKNFNDIISSINPLKFCAEELNPQIKDTIEEMKSLPNVIKADISGSGSCCFALFRTREDLEKAKKWNSNCVLIASQIKI